MRRAVLCTLLVLVFRLAIVAQDSSYYKAIQKGTDAPIQPKEFKQIEQDALKNYSQPETYERLVTAFGKTTEKVWGVLYGEVFCNLATDAERAKRIGALVYDLYDKSLSSEGGNLSANLTENAELSKAKPPFEMQFEMAFLLGAVPFGNRVSPLTIQKLTDIRKNQLSLWRQKGLPSNELVAWQQAIISSGHFEAYNYWLFQSARPGEFRDWQKEHQAQYQAWLEWQSKNKFNVDKPDFQRLRVMSQ